jgi:hypothetical protein
LFLNEHCWHTPCFVTFNEKNIPLCLIDQKVISERSGGREAVVNLWTIVCLAMGFLGENEREYISDDFKRVVFYGT